MDEQNFDEVINNLRFFISDLSMIPLEDFIKQLNLMMKKERFTSKYPKEILINMLNFANILLNLKSSYLMHPHMFQFK